MNIYDRNFLSLFFKTVILQHYLNPSWFFSLLLLVCLCFILYSIWKYYKKASASNEFIFNPETSIIEEPTIALSAKYILSLVLLFISSFITIGFINLIIRIIYSFGGILFETAHLNTIKGPEIEAISFQSVIQFSWLIGLFFYKSMFLIPSLFKLFVNCNYLMGYKYPKKISSLALVYLTSIILFQIINDYDVYLNLSLLSVFLWISSLVTFCLSLSLLKYEIDTFENEYPLRSFSYFITKIPEFGKDETI